MRETDPSRHSSNPFRISSPSKPPPAYGLSPLVESMSSYDPLAGFVEDGDIHNRHPALDTTNVAEDPQAESEIPEDNMDEEDDELLLSGSPRKCAPTEEVEATEDEKDDDAAGDDAEQEIDYGGNPEEYSRFESDEESLDESDEELSLKQKPLEEQQEIEEEIEDLLAAVPDLKDDYRIIDRLGTGTFSSVYKAQDLAYHSVDNTPWHGHHPPESSAHYQSVRFPFTSRVYVAVKRIYVTSNPERIENEVSILEETRGCRHVSQLITAFRHRDQVVVIMPYQPNEDFRDFYLELPWSGIRSYFRCLFRALRDVHARNIVHRDVKPANFLFNPETGIGTLCDFGLACRLNYDEMKDRCAHGKPTKNDPHGTPPQKPEEAKIRTRLSDARTRATYSTAPVGYPAQDNRPQVKVNRAGTRGFRAPEVLLKCHDQTGAIDIWAAGVILLFFLCGRFPMFRSNDDIEALLEIATIIGKRRMERTASVHHRTFVTNIPSISLTGVSWRDFCEKQNLQLNDCGPPAKLPSPRSSASSLLIVESSDERKIQVDGAIDLVDHLLDPDCTTRWTARQALEHPWLAADEKVHDDAFFPHPPVEGVCSDLHRQTETNGHTIQVANGVRELVAGEGLAIGNSPCEFHQDMVGVQNVESAE